jgi:hypothetical protein
MHLMPNLYVVLEARLSAALIQRAAVMGPSIANTILCLRITAGVTAQRGMLTRSRYLIQHGSLLAFFNLKNTQYIVRLGTKVIL